MSALRQRSVCNFSLFSMYFSIDVNFLCESIYVSIAHFFSHNCYFLRTFFPVFFFLRVQIYLFIFLSKFFLLYITTLSHSFSFVQWTLRYFLFIFSRSSHTHLHIFQRCSFRLAYFEILTRQQNFPYIFFWGGDS